VLLSRIIHRQDFYQLLFDEAIRLGVEIRLGAEVTDIAFGTAEVVLAGGERVTGDVIIGADGTGAPL
jgi:salicylate hydroxylase